MIHPVAVIGAGPFGLSTAAHLRARGVPVRVFGEPMVSWRDHMPEGMLLKSTPAASTIDAPQRGHTLLDYCDAAGIPRLVTDEDIIPVETFIAYGEWFQQKLVPELERVRVASVDRKAGRGRWKGRRPQVRGVAMNPVDHPLGGGEGKSSGGRHPVSPWGKPEGRTRKEHKPSDRMIIRRRGKKKR